ncbi:2-oxoglutarate dehydrogenase [Holotrichia oblita]|uniref:2-oxoglutarate dehydrogenase n=1 Tax=Holotrichia oblita TaxID=644536 RepID=A0ACB9TLJ8_HOLOL|nr:2-oxoglutarate dehydrogenase [Holotrichia oblita]
MGVIGTVGVDIALLESDSSNFILVSDEIRRKRNENSNFYRLVTAYRQHAHKIANVNPIALTETPRLPELDPKYYDLTSDATVSYDGIINVKQKQGPILDAVEFLKSAYCGSIGAEFSHLQTEEEREWFAENYESHIAEELDNVTKINLATDLLKSQAFDNFMAHKFVSVKRYGGEGAESIMAFFREFLNLCALGELEQIVIGMPHRGRLNVLTGFFNLPPAKIFAKLKGKPDFPQTFEATGDILSHLISSTDINVNSKFLHVSVLYNPSHLEASLPVSMGKTRAKQMIWQDGDYSKSDNRWSDKILNLQVHGDAALSGQGVNQETVQMSQLPHFEVGGSFHLIVNNQLGFTTPADRGRSSMYCTDVAKMVHAPVLHVNGDDPEMVLKATRIAFAYQRKFRKDVFIDLNCYRQWGHNELDDPTFTNPATYKIINSRDTVPNLYSKNLIQENVWTQQDAEKVINEHKDWLNDNLKEVDHYKPKDPCFKRQWEGYQQAKEVVTTWTTGLDVSLLKHIGIKSATYPQNFNIHENILKHHVTNRLAKIKEGRNLDWSTAEALAIGSLLYQGYNVRISGQDVGRGTFSQRHAMLVDQSTNGTFIPLNSIDPNQAAYLEVANSLLSEEAVLGFEYGMSIENPNNLIIWEAQFGDFFNGAQIMFDTFISSGETKWLWASALTVLLPHGYDGAGPEHSSSRIERFLQMTDSKEDKPDGDNINMQVSQPSTPAQYFHLLRRQMVRNFRKPLIIITPKTLLRLPSATSSLADMGSTTSFKPVLGDKMCNPEKVDKILLTSGRHYYTLLEKRESLGATNTAIIRLECFCPFPTLELRQELANYKHLKVILWCQEEPQNMGAWTFIKPRFEHLVGYPITYCGRPTMACPAVGVGLWHQQQVIDITTKPFSIKY